MIYAICANVEIKSDHKDDFKNRYEMFGGALQVKNVLAGVVVITSERIFFVNSALRTVSFKEMDIKDIRSIDETQAVMGTGELRIHGLTETFCIKVQKKKHFQEIQDALTEAKSKNNGTCISQNKRGDFLKFCPNCGTKNENEAKSCSNCGNSLESQFTSRNTEFKSPDVSSCIENNPAYKRRRLNLIIIAVFIAIVGLLLIIVFASGSDDSNDTSVAEIVEETKSDQTFLTTETDMVISSTTVLESTENESETETEIETVEASEPEQIIENALKSASGESNVSEISVYYNQANDYYTVDYHFIGTSWNETSFLRTIMSDYINTYRSVSSKIDVTLAFLFEWI
ncbi:MAG: zinc ribbon domain-containing protein [Ruminococcus sp.]|nr:zinc ribbon domain-containing protein [Ruminococcus sp.]